MASRRNLVDMKLYVCTCATLHPPAKSLMLPGCNEEGVFDMPSYFYIIEHPEGLVVIDAGMDDVIGDTVVPNGDPASRIEQLGYSPEDVRYLILTHMHIDHATYLKQFPHATILVRADEFDAAFNSEDPSNNGYNPLHYAGTEEWDYQLIPSQVDYDVFGDGSLILVDTAGHSAGHQSILVNLPSGKKIMLTGDATSIHENLEQMTPPGTSNNSEAAVEALRTIGAYQDKGYELFFAHDPEQALREFPEYYC